MITSGAAEFVQQYPSAACPQVQSTLAKLSLCRTHVLGGRKYACQDCGEVTTRYNSCGDRHCPRCSGSKRFDFARRAAELVLPGVTYYQVVFTLPSELSELALANRSLMADLLNASAWGSLSRCIGKEQGYQPAAMSVLHTWNQRMQAHWHVHMLVPGGGPSLSKDGLSGDGWTSASAPAGGTHVDGYYLVDAERLRQSYRRKALARLCRLREQGQLRLDGKFAYLQDEDNWTAFINHLSTKSWVAHIGAPPSTECGPDQVIKYLTRYLTGGPIGDARIRQADNRQVTFTARCGTQPGGNHKHEQLTVPLAEFVRRWCLHIQPSQLTKTRYLGGWSCSKQKAYMQRCRRLRAEHTTSSGPRPALQPDSVPATQTTATQTPELLSFPTELLCPACCSRRMQLLEDRPKPAWSELFRPEQAGNPSWYVDTLLAEARQFWDANQGEGFYDWYLTEVLEGAKGPLPDQSPQPPPFSSAPVQLYFPSMH